MKAEPSYHDLVERMRIIIEHSNELFYLHDTNHILSYVSPTSKKILGYTPEEMMLKWTELATDNPINQKGIEITEKAIKTGEQQPSYFVEIIKKDKSHTLLEVDESPVKDSTGKVVAIVGALRDVTKRKLAEKALQESEANYRHLFHHAPAGLYEFDMQNRRFLSVNDVMCEYTGYSEAEFLKLDAIDLLSEDSLESLATLLEKAAAGDSNPDPVEYRIKGKNQREFWVLVHSRFSYDTQGVPWKVTGVAHDLTERRRAEEETKKLEKKLMQVQKMEALGTLSGGIAHDFNNLMTGILGNTSLMLFGLDENHEHYDRLKQIEQLVKRGASLTRQLLGLSRQGTFEAKPTNLNKLICDSVDIYGRTQKDIQIHTKLQNNIWSVVADPGQIEQVLLNLLINAWQAMPQGGNIHIETHNYILDKTGTMAHENPANKYVKTTVTDTGIGMDKITQQKVFDPFFTTKEMQRGTGLGLASAYGIIQNHEGMIDVQSELGMGTTFTFYLPVSDKESVEQLLTTPDIIPGQGMILLIDDEKMVAETAKTMLEKLGYRVTTVTSGKEALSMYASHPERFDMVMLDMVMPDMGGTQTYEQLKQIDTKVKVLLSSGYSINDQVKKLLSLGCKGFIQKPFTVHELSQKVGGVLA